MTEREAILVAYLDYLRGHVLDCCKAVGLPEGPRTFEDWVDRTQRNPHAVYLSDIIPSLLERPRYTESIRPVMASDRKEGEG